MALTTREKNLQLVAALVTCAAAGALFAVIGLAAHRHGVSLAVLLFLIDAMACFLCVAVTMSMRTQAAILRQLAALSPHPASPLTSRLGEVEFCSLPHDQSGARYSTIELAAPCFLWGNATISHGQMKRMFTNIGGLATSVTIQGPQDVIMKIAPTTLPTEAGGFIIATHSEALPEPLEFTIAFTDRLGNRSRKAFRFTKTSMMLTALTQ